MFSGMQEENWHRMGYCNWTATFVADKELNTLFFQSFKGNVDRDIYNTGANVTKYSKVD